MPIEVAEARVVLRDLLIEVEELRKQLVDLKALRELAEKVEAFLAAPAHTLEESHALDALIEHNANPRELNEDTPIGTLVIYRKPGTTNPRHLKELKTVGAVFRRSPNRTLCVTLEGGFTVAIEHCEVKP